MKTWQAESGWILDRKGNSVNKDGTRDFGICQQNSRYHAHWIFKHFERVQELKKQMNREKNKEKRKQIQEEIEKIQYIYSDSFLNPYQQLDRCIGIWNDAKKRGRLKTTFYAYNVRDTKGVLQSLTFHY